MTSQLMVDVENSAQVLAQIQALDRKAQNSTVRKATVAAGKVVFKAAQTSMATAKQTGYTRRSLRQVNKSRKGTTTVRIGQQKRKQFKARKSPRVKGRNLSQIQRAGKPVPIHWIERGTKAHTVRARPGSVLVWQAGRKTKLQRGLGFARSVRVPGMRARHVLRSAARSSVRTAASAFNSTARQELSRIPNA